MNQLYTLTLACATLLLAGCGKDEQKKNDPAPVDGLTCLMNGASYQGSAIARSATANGMQTLTVDATQTVAANKKVYVSVFYRKPSGRPNTEFKLVGARYEGDNLPTQELNDNPVGTLSNKSGRWTGTFRVQKLQYGTGKVQYELTNGVLSVPF